MSKKSPKTINNYTMLFTTTKQKTLNNPARKKKPLTKFHCNPVYLEQTLVSVSYTYQPTTYSTTDQNTTTKPSYNIGIFMLLLTTYFFLSLIDNGSVDHSALTILSSNDMLNICTPPTTTPSCSANYLSQTLYSVIFN